MKTRVLFVGRPVELIWDAGAFAAVSFATGDDGLVLCMADSKQLASYDPVRFMWVTVEGAFEEVRVHPVMA